MGCTIWKLEFACDTRFWYFCLFGFDLLEYLARSATFIGSSNSDYKACLKDMESKKNSAAGSPQTLTQGGGLPHQASPQTLAGGSPHKASTGGTGTQTQLPANNPDKKVDNDVSPASTLGAETLALDFWDVPQVEGDNLTVTLWLTILPETSYLLTQTFCCPRTWRPQNAPVNM